MITNTIPRFQRFSSAIAGVALILTLAACGSSGDQGKNGQENGSQSTQSNEAKEARIPSFEGKPLYEAIVFARDNNLSYTIKDEKGDSPKTENSREWKVVKQSPDAGVTFKDRNKLELTVESSK